MPSHINDVAAPIISNIVAIAILIRVSYLGLNIEDDTLGFIGPVQVNNIDRFQPATRKQ